MNKVVEHLAQAICSLTKADKTKVIQHMLEDPDVKDAVVRLLVDSLGKSRAGQNSGDSLVLEITSSKELGMRVRDWYISQLQQRGVRIEQVDRVWAKTPTDFWVAIPFAKEQRPNRWFLGLPEAKVIKRMSNGGASVVLLCQSNTGDALDFVLPESKVREIVPHLSKSQGQLKFNLKKVGSRFHLVIPNKPTVDVSDYKGAVSILQS
jgi:hypothetical protein